MISKGLIEFVKNFEGLSCVPYVCPAGKCTVGYGHVLPSGEKTGVITPEAAENFLVSDLKEAEKSLKGLLLTENQHDALCSLVFNIGRGQFENSQMRRLLFQGDYVAAAGQFPRWCFVNGRGSAGLLRRRIEEMKLFMQKE